MMKRILKFLSVVTIIAISATFVACNDNKNESNNNAKQEEQNKQDAPVADTGKAPEGTSAPVGEGEEPVSSGEELIVEEEQLIKAKICVPNEAFNAVNVIETEVREITAEEIFTALCNEGVVKGTAEVIAFKQKGKVLALNVTQGFVDGIIERGPEKEHYTIASVVNTFLYNFKAEKILILVEGKPWRTTQAAYGLQPFIKIPF